jgi:hypothetical protein
MITAEVVVPTHRAAVLIASGKRVSGHRPRASAARKRMTRPGTKGHDRMRTARGVGGKEAAGGVKE